MAAVPSSMAALTAAMVSSASAAMTVLAPPRRKPVALAGVATTSASVMDSPLSWHPGSCDEQFSYVVSVRGTREQDPDDACLALGRDDVAHGHVGTEWIAAAYLAHCLSPVGHVQIPFKDGQVGLVRLPVECCGPAGAGGQDRGRIAAAGGHQCGQADRPDRKQVRCLRRRVAQDGEQV